MEGNDMILKKPYAIFIKYFRLLHFVLAIFIFLVLYRSSKIYNFFRVYSIDYRAVSNEISSYSFNFMYYYLHNFSYHNYTTCGYDL